MSTSPIYFSTPGVAQAQATVANVNVDGSGTLVSLVSGTAAGRRIARVRAVTAIAGAQLANKISFFESVDAGATKKFLCDVLMPVLAAETATIRAAYAEVPELVGKVLANGASTNTLYASTWIGQATNITVEYNDA